MLALWRKSYDQPRQHIKKQRHYFANKVCLVKALVFPVVIYGWENWTIKKAEHQRTDVFELWCWRRLLNIPWTARRSNQPILKEISPEYSLGRTDAEAETPILWPANAKSWFIGKDRDTLSSNHLILCCPLPLNLSQLQGLFQRVGSSYRVAKVLKVQLQHQSF